MKLLIFGATGSTGLQLVKQALDQGHTVTAFARNPAKLEIDHKNLQMFQGDALNASSVEAAMHGQDAVLVALGASAFSKSKVRSAGTQSIIRAMEATGVKRLVCQTSLGYGDSEPLLPFIYKYVLVPFLLRDGFADHALQEDYIKKSQLDWIVARPGTMTNGRRTGVYKHGFSGTDRSTKVKVSRADVADFMLKQLTDNTYLHQTVGISY